MLTVQRPKIKFWSASSNPVRCLASPNSGDFARRKAPTGGEIQELWNAQLAKSPHQPGVPPLGEADDKCIIPRTCIKLAADHINEALTIVFNYSLLQGVFPDIFKISKVTPVDKGGEDTDPSNYRPISTLSALAQIFVKLICKQLVSYLEKEKILYEFQFGFRKGHSTSQAITEIAQNLRKAVDNNMYSCGVFLDFSKAFDTVNHKMLLSKLESYGIRGSPLQLFTSYLTNRKQYTSLGNYLSSMQTISCGVPQGSSLGPVFLIYINDLPNNSEALTFRIFADDTNIFASSHDAKSLETLINAELKKVKDCCDINKLSINLSKTNYMIIKSSSKRNHEFIINMQRSNGTNHRPFA